MMIEANQFTRNDRAVPGKADAQTVSKSTADQDRHYQQAVMGRLGHRKTHDVGHLMVHFYLAA